MGKLTAGLISVGLLFVLFSFVYAIHEIIPSETQIPLPGADAQKLGDYIRFLCPGQMLKNWVTILSGTIPTRPGISGRVKAGFFRGEILTAHC
jgi:hypothetical protein